MISLTRSPKPGTGSRRPYRSPETGPSPWTRDCCPLAYLETLAPADLVELYDQVTELLWSDHGHVLGRLAAASKLLPTGVTATISERALGPLVSARLAGLLEPLRAVEVAAKLSTPFLADIASELDPRRATAVITQISPRQIAAVTSELVRRQEYVTMGRYVGHLRDDALVAALGAMDSPALLQVAFVLEDKRRLPRVIDLLARHRLTEIVRAAADEDLWLEALDLLGHLDERQRAELAIDAFKLGRPARKAIIAAVVEHDLWSEALIIAKGDPTLQRKLAERRRDGESPERRSDGKRADRRPNTV